MCTTETFTRHPSIHLEVLDDFEVYSFIASIESLNKLRKQRSDQMQEDAHFLLNFIHYAYNMKWCRVSSSSFPMQIGFCFEILKY